MLFDYFQGQNSARWAALFTYGISDKIPTRQWTRQFIQNLKRKGKTPADLSICYC